MADGVCLVCLTGLPGSRGIENERGREQEEEEVEEEEEEEEGEEEEEEVADEDDGGTGAEDRAAQVQVAARAV